MGVELNNTMRILVTYAKTYDMPAEPGRDAMRGCTVHYFFLGQDGREFAPYSEWDTALAVGYQRGKVSLDFPFRAKIPVAPGIYDGEFAMTVGGDGKPVARLVDLKFVEPFRFFMPGEGTEGAQPASEAAPAAGTAAEGTPAAAPETSAKTPKGGR